MTLGRPIIYQVLGCRNDRYKHSLNLNLQQSGGQSRAGFSLVEILFVIAIISLLAALLFPTFLSVRGKVHETTCQSNLGQIGLSIALYIQDNNSHYPYAVDPADRETPLIWASHPDFVAAIPHIGMIQDVLQPYLKSKDLFCCPSDTGFTVSDFTHLPLNATPTSFEKYGTSYYYRTQIAALKAHEALIQDPSQVNVLFDGAGQWHGTLVPLLQRYNVLFADGHVKNLTREGIDAAWAVSLPDPTKPTPFPDEG